MGKRSNFARNERDFYPTPRAAVGPLLPHLPTQAWFYEPCAGNGQLANILEEAGHHCCGMSDIEPQHEYVSKIDVFECGLGMTADCFITNPPWDRDILHPLIDHLRQMAPTWLLFDADWAHTKQARPYLPYCRKIVAVGRVKWIPDSKHTGKDNCCWYLFDREPCEIIFFGRT